MNYKEKYKKALERARKELQEITHKDCDDTTRRTAINIIYNLFPELKESEDERTRKDVIQFVQSRLAGFPECERFVTWLEKQGNKSVNIDVESMVSSYEQRLESQGGIKNTPLVNMCLTAFRHGVENVLDELYLKKLEKQDEKDPCIGCTNDKGCVTCEHGALRETHTRTLNADKVIEWIDEHVPTKFEDTQNYVNQFKQDFGL